MRASLPRSFSLDFVLRLALMMPLAGALPACQEAGNLQDIFSPTVSQSQTQSEATPSKPPRISQAFYLPFYDQGDHLASLVKDSRFEDAARLYDEQREYFAQPEAAAKHTPLLRRAADHFNAAAEAELASALGLLAAAWPAPRSDWAALRARIADGAKALAAYPDYALLKEPPYRSETVSRLGATLDDLKRKLTVAAPEAFTAFDHFSGNSFFEAYPIDLDKTNFMARHFGALKDRLDRASSPALRAFAQAYPREILGNERWREIGSLLVGVHLKESSRGGAPDLKAILQAVRTAKVAGFEPSAIPGARITFVEATSRTLLKSGGVEFPAEIDVDLPVEVAKASLDKALTDATAAKADYVIVFDVALAKAQRRVTDTKKTPSRVVTGHKTKPNPDYNVIQNELNQAQIEMQGAAMQSASTNAQFCYGAGCFGKIFAQLANAAAEAAAREKVQQLMERLRSTPMTIEEPIYEPYQFDKATVRGTKTMTVHYYVIDRRRSAYFKSTFDIVERRTFEAIYNVHNNDPAKDTHYASGQKDEDVKAWEEASATVRLSQLVDHYLAHRGQAKPLPDLAVLRQEMLSDKNKALAKLEAGRFDARPLNDPRFGNVVVVYVAAKKSLGSGFFVAPDVVLTNWHVVEDKPFVEMKMYDKQETFGKVTAKDVRLDLALIKVQSRGQPVRFYSDKTLDLGKTVEAIGHPKGLEFSITRGVVSAVRRQPSISLSGGGGKEVLYIQTDAPVNPGNSGGPLFLSDRVVGVNTWGFKKDTSEGLNFAIHYSEVLEFLREHLPGFQAQAEERKAAQ
ncbi:MAG: trypsin-like peptidase domain-containing protein [Rhodospirillales bacterium]|nr:trypsin-like peptidase domain-containing protein [Rhodospirillales bacterium]